MSETYYARVRKPLIDKGLCSMVKCGGKLYANGLCKKCYNKGFPHWTPLSERPNVWANVDWSKSNKQIAFETGRSNARVCTARVQHCPPCPHCHGIHPRKPTTSRNTSKP